MSNLMMARSIVNTSSKDTVNYIHGVVSEVVDASTINVELSSKVMIPATKACSCSVGDTVTMLYKNGRYEAISVVGGSGMMAGVIIAYGGTDIPYGWLPCDGRSLFRTTYKRLFDAIGTTYGAASSKTFRIPDLRGRFAQGSSSTLSVGTKVDAGLPNITGTLNIKGYGESPFVVSHTGAFDSGASYQYKSGWSSAWVNTTTGPTFDASKSNDIYGASDTVQPPSIVLNYVISY